MSTASHLSAGRVEAWGLRALVAVTVAALLGYASFGLHPALLQRFPTATSFYGTAFFLFAQAQIWIAWGVLAAVLTVRAGMRWLPAFGLLYAVSLASELMGTTHGIPFGDYHYTPGLGARWLGHVPVVIPLSWFFMALPSFALAGAALPGRPLARVLMASFLLLAWDLVLDPAMSHATRYWVWGSAGGYYGMPLLNLFGWYVTGLALMTTLALADADRWLARVPRRWLGGYYAANLLLPAGMSLLAGLWGAVATAGLALGAAAAASALWSRRTRLAMEVPA